MSNATSTRPPLVPINKKKLLAKELAAIKQWKADLIQRDEDRRRAIRSKYRESWENYCIHGTYVGDPYGPDYLCYACEDGMSDYSYVIGNVCASAFRAQERYNTALNVVLTYADFIRQAQEPGKEAAIPILVGKIAEEIETLERIQEEWL